MLISGGVIWLAHLKNLSRQSHMSLLELEAQVLGNNPRAEAVYEAGK